MSLPRKRLPGFSKPRRLSPPFLDQTLLKHFRFEIGFGEHAACVVWPIAMLERHHPNSSNLVKPEAFEDRHATRPDFIYDSTSFFIQLYRHIRNQYLSSSKTFQDGSGNGDFGKINSNDFQDGNWESMEMKGDCGRQDGNGDGNSSEFQDGNGNGNLGESKFSRITRLPVIILTRTVMDVVHQKLPGKLFAVNLPQYLSHSEVPHSPQL